MDKRRVVFQAACVLTFTVGLLATVAALPTPREPVHPLQAETQVLRQRLNALEVRVDKLEHIVGLRGKDARPEGMQHRLGRVQR